MYYFEQQSICNCKQCFENHVLFNSYKVIFQHHLKWNITTTITDNQKIAESHVLYRINN